MIEVGIIIEKNESIIIGTSLLYLLLCKDEVWMSNTLVLKHRRPETRNQTIQLLSWSFFPKNVEMGLKKDQKHIESHVFPEIN